MGASCAGCGLVMLARPYTEQDYPMVCQWWDDWKWPRIPESSLPQVGVVVENEGSPVCAAWIYRTDSDTCLVEWFISDRTASKERRKGTIEHLIGAAKHM